MRHPAAGLFMGTRKVAGGAATSAPERATGTWKQKQKKAESGLTEPRREITVGRLPPRGVEAG